MSAIGFGGKRELPMPGKPPAVPDLADELLRRAKEEELRRQQGRHGRRESFLGTDPMQGQDRQRRTLLGGG